MSVKKRILSIILSFLIILGLIPGGSVTFVEAAQGYADNFSMVLSDSSHGANRYLTTADSNAFNVIMYNSTFSGTFGDQHMSGIELLMHGYRIATNGDIHYLPTPEQWDATPAPSRGNKTFDEATNTITVPMTFSGASDGTLRYNIVATPEPEGGGVILSVILTSDMPTSLAGKARFNLEFIPSRYKSKSFQADSTGSGVYDTFGIFPLHPQSTMAETQHPDLPTQAWYVKEWNADRGESQPLPFAKGYGFSFAPEDELYNINITSDTGELELFDGRDRAQNGWYVLSGLIPGGKNGDVVAKWHIRPKVKQNWVRDPNITFSQAGYAPNQEKFAVVELDKYDNNYPSTASLLHVNADGSKDVVYTADVTAPVTWQRYKYVNFDFTHIVETGMYVVQYGDQESDIFPIANDVYDTSWQSALSVFLAVQMDHIEVRDGNRVWHGASHMDDCSIGPLGVSWFDGMSMPSTMPSSIADRGIESGEYIPGLNVGGWFDAGDFDLQGSRETEVLQDLIFAAEAFDNMDGYDNLSVEWDDKTGGVVEMHKPDGIPDIVQQIAHGIKYVLAQYDTLGGYGGTMELRRLRQYTHLGDPSSDTDGFIYDPALSEGQIVERNGLVYSGVPDDRVLLLNGGGGSFNGKLTGTTTADIAGAAYVLKDYYPELADKCLNTVLEIWDNERAGVSADLNTEWSTLVQLMLATDKFGNGRFDEFKTRLTPLVSSAFAITDGWFGKTYGITSRYNAMFIMDFMDEGYRTAVRTAVTEYIATVNYPTTANPFGVQWTTGAGWGGSPTIIGFGQRLGIMYKFFPDITELKTYTLRAANYIFGRHPVTNNSWLSGVGTKSHLHPYNSNRADESFIPGSILPGHITVSPDIVESLDDFSFLWFENESIINYQSKWISLGLAASMMAKETASEVQAPTKDFTNDFMMSIKKTGSTDGYLQTPGFNLFMYNNTFDTELGDKKNAGIELIQSGRRIATNGDISLLNVPEQWDSIIPPILNSRTVDDVNNILSASMSIPADSKGNPTVNYELKAEPEAGGIKLTVKLDAPLPSDLAGKAGFSLQFTPGQFISKSFQADADGDGNYDTFGVFPLVPQDDMVSAERARTEDQPWYVKNWYKDEGNKQPLPLATGKKMTFCAEDSENRIRITSDSSDLALYDGRSNTQDGWFVLRTMIPVGATEVVWHISPDVKQNWTRKPNVAYNQAGYAPDISKIAVIELDPEYNAPTAAYIDRLNADGTYTEVFSGEIGTPVSWARYNYREFDFSAVKAPGMYAIRYAGERSDPFPIAGNVYERTWQASLSGFLAVQMDHMKVREGYRIWHNQTFADDALQAPLNIHWFDGWSMDSATDSPYAPYEHIPGLAVGGWFNPSAYDLDTASNLQVIQDLALAFDEFEVDYDTLMVDTDASFVEMHRADGYNDIQQQVKQGILQILGQIDNAGFVFKGMKVPSLEQYSQSGDASKATDGLVYDSTLVGAAGEVLQFGDSAVLTSEAVYGLKSGKLDDRFAFVGTKDVALQFDAAAALASAAYVLKGFDDALAPRCLEAAEKIWNEETILKDESQDAEQITAEWKAAIQLVMATNGEKEDYKQFLKDVAPMELNTTNFGNVGWKAVLALKYMDQDFVNQFIEALRAYIPVLDGQISEGPFGVPLSGGNASVLEMGVGMSVLHKYFPGIVSSKYTLSALNYILGTHMYNNTSWVSGVGTRSATLGYGSNRADRYYIAGGIVAGAVDVLPDFPEAVDNYAFLRDETGYSLDTAAKWIILGNAANAIVSEGAYIPVTEVAIDNSTLSFAAGAAGQLTATVAPADATDKTVIFTSTNPEIATVTGAVYDSTTGKTIATVNGIAPGLTTIRATSVSNAECFAECTVTVMSAEVKTVMSGNDSVQPGSSFTVGISLDSVTQDVFAEDISLSYDSNVFEYVSVVGVDTDTQIVKEDKSVDGRVRLIAANIGGVSKESSQILNLVFKVKGGVQNTTGNIAITMVKLGIAPSGTVIEAELTSRTITIAATTEVDKSQLIAAISSAETIYANSVVGSQPGQYPQAAKDALKAAIDAAITVRENVIVTQEQVDNGVISLNNAVQTFKASVVPSPGVNKEALSAAISVANTLFTEAEVGTKPGQYPQQAKDDFNTAIIDARSVYNNPNATQSQVDNAVTTLNIAIDTFRAAVNRDVSADLNGDGSIDVGDLAIVAFYYGKDSTSTDWDEAKVSDVNGDKKIDISDLAYVALKILD